MQKSPFDALLAALLDILETGLSQDAAVAHFIGSTHGDLTPQALAALVADPDDPQAASLLELLLFPGPDTALALEDAMGQARLDARDAARLAEALADNATRAIAVMPDGTRLSLPLTREQAARFVSRLAPHRSLPDDLRRLLETRRPADARALAVAARQTGPDWTPAAVSFCRTLLYRLSPEVPDAAEAIRYVLRFLATLPGASLPLPALMARRSQLVAQLRRAARQDEALANSNYETVIMAGNRLPYLHAPDIARELAQADAVILAVTGRPAIDTGASCQNMGVVADMKHLLRVFDGEAG
ncbi:hypothetical protein [Solidesulfovibrio sp.]